MTEEKLTISQSEGVFLTPKQIAESIDKEEAERYAQILSGLITWQWFSDQKEGKRKGKPGFIHGSLESVFSSLVKENVKGSGIFAMINEGDGYGRSASNVVKIRSLFVDLDGAPLGPILDFPLKPSMIVETSPERYHAYWLVEDVELDDFSMLQKALAVKFDADPTVHDLCRVMRVPGFYHLKGEPFKVRIIQ